jgi:hypothetical protein
VLVPKEPAHPLGPMVWPLRAGASLQKAIPSEVVKAQERAWGA